MSKLPYPKCALHYPTRVPGNMFFVDDDLQGLNDNDLSSGRESDPEARMDLGHHTQGGHQGTGIDPEARGGHISMDSWQSADQPPSITMMMQVYIHMQYQTSILLDTA